MNRIKTAWNNFIKMTDGQLSTKQRKAAEAIAQGLNYRQAAKAAGVGRTTVTKWRKSEHFSAYLDELKDAIQQAVVDAASGVLQNAQDVLLGVMDSVETDANTRARIAMYFHDKYYAPKSGEDFKTRVEQVDKVLYGDKDD